MIQVAASMGPPMGVIYLRQARAEEFSSLPKELVR